MNALLDWIRENPKTAGAIILALVAFGGTVARTEEAVEKVPKLENAIIELKEIHAKQAGREEGEKEGEAKGQRETLQRICARHPDLPECEAIR
jgi:hypothetical protein